MIEFTEVQPVLAVDALATDLTYYVVGFGEPVSPPEK